MQPVYRVKVCRLLFSQLPVHVVNLSVTFFRPVIRPLDLLCQVVDNIQELLYLHRVCRCVFLPRVRLPVYKKSDNPFYRLEAS